MTATVDTTSPGLCRRRVLIVEDNSDAREMLRELCSLWGHEVYEAANGLDGIEFASDLQPDVMLVDIGLPGADGYEVARRVRAAFGPRQRPRLVAITGYGSGREREAAFEAGFDMHLTKPASATRLREALDLCDRRSQ